MLKLLYAQATQKLGMGCHRTKSSLDLEGSLTRPSVRSKAPQSRQPHSSRVSIQPTGQLTHLWSTPTTWIYSEWSAFGSTKLGTSLPLASITSVPTKPSTSPPDDSLTTKCSAFPSTKFCPWTRFGPSVGSPIPSPFVEGDHWQQKNPICTFVTSEWTRRQGSSIRSRKQNIQRVQNPTPFTISTCICESLAPISRTRSPISSNHIAGVSQQGILLGRGTKRQAERRRKAEIRPRRGRSSPGVVGPNRNRPHFKEISTRWVIIAITFPSY